MSLVRRLRSDARVREPAVDMDGLARHVGARRSAQATDHGGDFERRTLAPERNLRVPVAALSARCARSVDLAWRDAVHANVEFREILRKRLGEPDVAVLGGRD